MRACAPFIAWPKAMLRWERLAAVIRRSGRRVVLVFPPDKSAIHPEYLPASFAQRACLGPGHDAAWAAIEGATDPGRARAAARDARRQATRHERAVLPQGHALEHDGRDDRRARTARAPRRARRADARRRDRQGRRGVRRRPRDAQRRAADRHGAAVDDPAPRRRAAAARPDAVPARLLRHGDAGRARQLPRGSGAAGVVRQLARRRSSPRSGGRTRSCCRPSSARSTTAHRTSAC